MKKEWDIKQDSQCGMKRMVGEWLADFLSPQTAASEGETACSSEVTLRNVLYCPDRAHVE